MALAAPKWSANKRLQAASENKPSMKPGEPDRAAVKLLQEVLISSGFAIPSGPTGNYLSETAGAVKAVEKRFNLTLDHGVAGREVLTALDGLLNRATPPTPRPPVPPPVPIVGTADVQTGPLGPRGGVVADYYRNCGLETIGPARIQTTGLRSYTTFEGLLDLLLTRPGPHQVVVNHGDPANGLIVRWCRETAQTNTSDNIVFFSKIADALEQGTANQSNPDFQDSLDTVTFILGIARQVALRIADKIVKVRKKPMILHLRACNIPQEVALRYKQAFRAPLVTFHPVRLLFLEIKPAAFAPGRSAAEFPPQNNTARDRARVFTDPFGELTTLVIAVRDLDGHTNVFNFSFVEQMVPAQIHEWAKVLIGKWNGPQTEFVLPAMWDNGERSFSCPMETAWRQKLQFV